MNIDGHTQHLGYFALPENLALPENHWLEVSLVPDKYPSFNVAVITMTEEELATHIQDN